MIKQLYQWTARLLVVAVLLVGLIACGNPDGSTSATPPLATVPATEAVPTATLTDAMATATPGGTNTTPEATPEAGTGIPAVTVTP